MPRVSKLGEVGGGDNVAALFRKGSALIVCREICWRLSASAKEPHSSVRTRNGPEEKGTRCQVSTYGRCFWKVVHPTLGAQTPSPPRSYCCGPAPALTRWRRVWGTETDASPPASHRLPEQTCHKHIAQKHKESTFQWGNSHLCFCGGLAFEMLGGGWRALDVKLLRCLFSSGVTYGSSRVLRTTTDIISIYIYLCIYLYISI